MSVLRIDARCECDFCHKPFIVEIEPNETIQAFSDMEAIVRKAILAGEKGYTYGVRGQKTIDRFHFDYPVTIQGGLMLCDECSKICDQIDSVDVTKEQVEQALLGVRTV